MKIVIGSAATSYHKLLNRHPKDVDIWTDECKVVGTDSKIIPRNILKLIGQKDGYACPNSLFTIKCSHLGYDNPMWSKHFQDVLVMKHKGCVIEDELYYTLLDFWKTELGDKSFLSLNKTKEDFFTDGVVYQYDHDYLHEIVAHPNPPVYTKCLKQGTDVMIDNDKFFNMCYEDQIKMIKEEMTVIACERWLLRNPSMGFLKAWINGRKKTITNLTKGKTNEFIIRNIDKFVRPDVTMFNNVIRTLIEEK